LYKSLNLIFIKNKNLAFVSKILHFKKFNLYFSRLTTLFLNFKRKKFFPGIYGKLNKTYTQLSLGMLFKYSQKGKAFLKSKAAYILLTSFLRKILLYSSVNKLNFNIRRTPKYLKDILSTIFTPGNAPYVHPLESNNRIIFENKLNNTLNVYNLIFLKNKSYCKMKTKKKGRVKRKILKKLLMVNKVTD
tara:strand:- start:433 stop:999 length:567 start_codon:yes stop_codon:yes gene_type:complete